MCAGTNSYVEAFLLTGERVHNMVADSLKCEEAAEEVAKLVNKTKYWKQILSAKTSDTEVKMLFSC